MTLKASESPLNAATTPNPSDLEHSNSGASEGAGGRGAMPGSGGFVSFTVGLRVGGSVVTSSKYFHESFFKNSVDILVKSLVVGKS